MSESRYRKNAGSVYNLNLHFVWCSKYRRSVLHGQIAERLKELLYQKAAELSIEVVGLEVMPDHVHLFVSVAPTDAPQHLANQFKGFTSRILRQEFPALRSRLPSLWSRSYYVGAAGSVSSDVIERYIAAQKGK